MAESINEIAIKLSVHAEGVTSGFRTAAEEARGFQKEIERFSYAVDKGLGSRKFGPLLDEALTAQSVNDRLAKEKVAQQEFNAWFQAESEKEFQAWYAIEQKKEQVKEQQLIDDRQRAINTSNAQNSQRQLPAETTARADENAKLQQAIMERYALLDKEDRQTQLYAGNLVGIEKLKAERLQQVADQLQAQKDADFAAYKAQLAQEEVTSAAAAARTNRIERARQLDAKRAADDARRQALNDMRADIAERERLSQDAAGGRNTRSILQRIREQARDAQRARTDAQRDATQRNNANIAAATKVIQQHLTVQERHAQELARLTSLYHSYNTVTGAALLSDQQFNRAKTSLILSTIRQQQAQRGANAAVQQGADQARILSGVLTQASFAAEDFIQGIVFGDIRTALLGAANNMTMVVRGLLQMQAASAAAGAAVTATGAATATATTVMGMGIASVVGLLVAIPAAVVGLGSYLLWLNRAKADTRDLEQALADLNEQWIKFERLSTINRQGRREAASIGRTSSSEAADAKAAELLAERVEMEKALIDVQNKVSRQNREIFEHTMGGANALQELKDQIANTIAFGSAEEVAAAQRMTQLLDQASAAAEQGDFNTMIAAMQEINNLASDGALRDWTEWVDDLGSFDALQKLFNTGVLGTFFKDAGTDFEALAAIQKALADSTLELTAAERELLINAENILKAKLKAQELFAVEERHRRLMLQLAQDEIRFQLQATDAQKEAADIQNQLAKFLGVDDPNPMQGMDPNDMSAEQARQSAEFLELMWRNLDRQKKEILDEKQRVTPVGGLEQNTYQAQADAFRQVLEATNRQADPQLTSIDRRLEEVNNQLEDITGIRIVQ